MTTVDLITAATAIEHGCSLVSHYQAFHQITGWHVLDWNVP